MSEHIEGQSAHAEARPNPLQAAETVRGLAECWRELDLELLRHGAGARPGRPGSRMPFDEDVADAKREIEGFALTHCQMLVSDTDWEPPRDASTPNLLEAIAMRIGHFTHNEDSLVAWDFRDELDTLSRKVWPIARPSGIAWIPIAPCFVDGCEGEMRVRIDRDKPMDREWLALWRPVAVCKADREHKCDAKLLVREEA